MNAKQLVTNPYGRIIHALEQSLREILYQHIDPFFKQWVKNFYNLGLLTLHFVSGIVRGNKIEVPSQVLNLSLSSAQVEDLKSGKETELIEGFVSKRGNLFSAYLKMEEDGRLAFRFPEAGETSRKPGVPDQILGVTLSPEQKTKLENKEETNLIEGLVGKKGISFSAYLRMDESGSVQFRFPDRQIKTSKKSESGQAKQDLPAQIKQDRPGEPSHFSPGKAEKTDLAEKEKNVGAEPEIQEQKQDDMNRANPDTDKLLEGLVVYGKQIPEAQIEKLKLGQKTDLIEGFNTKSGKVFAAELELKNNKLYIYVPARKINTGIRMVPKKIMGVEISAQNKRLLNWGRKSELIKGMKTPEGIVFNGWLKMDQDKKLIVKSSPSTILVDLYRKEPSVLKARLAKKEMG